MFIKTTAVSRAVYIGQIFECPADVLEKIHSAIMFFLWYGKLERPDPTISYRTARTGGLGMVNIRLFLQALFVRPVLMTLTGPDTVHRGLLRYWLACPTRDFLPYYSETVPRSFFARPLYLNCVVSLSRNLFMKKLFGPEGPKQHRVLYHSWLAESLKAGAVETLLPDLDWPTMWKRTAALPHDVRETFFMFNHRLLFTRSRAHRLDPANPANCLLCQKTPETDIHLFIECPKRASLFYWLHSKLTSLGYSGPLFPVIRGHGIAGRDSNHQFLLVAAYVHVVWKARTRKRLPEVQEIATYWNLLKKRNGPPENVGLDFVNTE
jgi:hypothetical protein